MPHQLSYRHLVTLVQIGDNWKEIKKILRRTNQITKELSKKDEERLKQRAEHAKYWLKNFAPEMVKFKVKKGKINIKLENEQIQFLKNFYEKLSQIKWEAEDIHNAIYETTQEEKISPKKAFNTIYQIILGKNRGPRAGYFLSNLEEKFVIERIKEVIK